MKTKLRITIVFLISISSCLFADNGEDSSLESGVLSFKLGYYPYQSWTLLENEGYLLSISHNDFNRFLNWGYSVSLHKSFKDNGNYAAHLFAGISIVHRTKVFNGVTLFRLASGLSTAGYPAFTNLLEVDYIFNFYGAAINLSLSTGLIMFRPLIPISISIGFTI